MDHILKDDINHINHEDWMSCLPEKLWDVPLTHLSIPGEPLRKLSTTELPILTFSARMN